MIMTRKLERAVRTIEKTTSSGSLELCWHGKKAILVLNLGWAVRQL